MNRSLSVFLFGAMIATVNLSTADAGLMTYQGIDQNPGDTVPPAGFAAAARASFLSNLSGGVGTEDFELFATGTNGPLNLSFPGSSGSISATLSSALSGDIEIRSGSIGAGRFPTSGSQYLETSGDADFTIDFSDPISAFGFFGTDIGDFAGDLVLTLTNGTTETITATTAGSSDGALLFFGFTNDMGSYTKIEFENTGSGDFFGFDDMTIGDPGQIVNPRVPEPASLAIFGAMGLMTVGMRRRRV